MTEAGDLDITILICTRNRCRLLGETLDSLGKLAVPPSWRCEVLVVDNGSTDDTRGVVLSRAAAHPLPVRYLFESTPGRSSALNAGITASAAKVVACTDDDVLLTPRWLEVACAPLLRDSSGVSYTGGPVRPIWDGPRPDWFPKDASNLWGMTALLDYGPQEFIFEDRQKVPVGANCAMRRDMLERVGGFVPALGRSSTRTLLGQELPELFRRTSAIGARGLYVPQMEVFHHIPAARLTTSYLRRWWFGKGVSRARVDRIHPVTELGVDLRTTPHVAGIPRFMFGDALRDTRGWVRQMLRRNLSERVVFDARLSYFLGYVWERLWRRWRAADLDFTSPALPAPR